MTEHLTEAITCPYCKGANEDPEQPWRTCGWCLGLGVLHVTKPHAPALREAPDEPPGRDLSPECGP